MNANKRQTNIPETLTGRKFKYDRKTTVVPVEPSGVRGQTIFSHEHLESLLRGKREKP